MKLSGQQFWQLQQALVSAFPEPGMLKQLVIVHLERNLATIAGGGNLIDLTRELITWCEAQGVVDQLLRGAQADNPGNEDLKAFITAYRAAGESDPEAPVDLSTWVTIRDTGAEGTSASMTVATAMETVLSNQSRPAVLSARYLNEKAKKHDEVAGEGTYLETVIYVAERFGVPEETAWPYQAGNKGLPEGRTWADLDAEASRRKGHGYRIASYDEIGDQLRLGRPVMVGVRMWDKAWMSGSAAETGRIGVPSPTDQLMGLHVVTIVSRDPRNGELRFANSWGSAWGDRGFGTLSQEAADARLDLAHMWAVDVPLS